MTKLFYLFALIVPILGSNFDYKINDNTQVDYLLSYGDIVGNDYMFSTGNDNNYLINNTVNNTTECKWNCAYDDNCLGIFENYTGDYECSCLSNLGEPLETNTTVYSYIKVKHSIFKEYKHSIEGYLWDVPETNKNSTLYLDLNHNGILDEGEPNQEVMANTAFTFDNLENGMYLLKQIVPDGCYQIYPGLNGTFQHFKGDGFVDNVVRYIHYGHHKHSYAHGGFITENMVEDSGEHKEYLNKNFSMVLGENNNTYLSFYPGYSITFSFVDESVMNNPGDDIFIDIFKNSTVRANVSISSDDINFNLIGVLDTSNCSHKEGKEHIMLQSFDMGEYEHPATFVRLDFIGEDNTEKLNIIRVGIYERSLYLPPYGNLLSVPEEYFSFFYNDCNYYFGCNTYCNINFYYDNDYYSCMEGCDLFDKNNRCNCLDYNGTMNFYDYYNDDYFDNDQIGYEIFNYDMCEHGCDFQMSRYVYPNYTIIEDSIGLMKGRIMSEQNMTVDSLVEQCDSNEVCGSIAIGLNGEGNLYNSHRHIENKNYTFIKKNSHYTTTITSTTTSRTSSTITQTTTSRTSSTITQTTTSRTSSTITQTTTSQTSSTITQTTTSQTSSTITQTTTSQTSTITTSINIGKLDSSSSNSKKKKKELTGLYVVLGVLGSIILIFGIVMIGVNYTNKKKLNNLEIQNRDNGTVSYDNPLYNKGEVIKYNEETPYDYQDVQAGSYNEDYIEVRESSDV